MARLARSLAGQSSVCGFSVPLVSRADQRRRFFWPALWQGKRTPAARLARLLAGQALGLSFLFVGPICTTLLAISAGEPPPVGGFPPRGAHIVQKIRTNVGELVLGCIEADFASN